MGCSSCNKNNSGATPSFTLPKANKKASFQEALDCPFSGGLLIIWYNALKCVKDTGKLSLIGLTTYQANLYLGHIQSAINFPDNYCLFSVKLTDYQINILPRIIEHVPNCL